MTLKLGNVLTGGYEFDDADPEGYHAGAIKFGPGDRALTGDPLAVKAFEIPPGENLCPYHYEYVEEWLIVLEGSVVVRTPEGEEEAVAGNAVCLPAGPDGAHQLTNRGEGPALFVMVSSAHEPSVAVYPDSDKIGVWPGNPDDHVMLRRSDGHVGYYDGER
jgi:uncharacterized cupin superfamily protein